MTRVMRHELGHALDYLTQNSKVSAKPAMRELAHVYSDLNSQMYVPKGKIGVTPQALGYPRKDSNAELLAESLRAYLTDFNYLKSVAPKTAAYWRQRINTHPEVSRVIQLKSGAGVGLLGAMQASSEDRP